MNWVQPASLPHSRVRDSVGIAGSRHTAHNGPVHCIRHSVEPGPEGRCPLCAREDSVTTRRSAALLGLAAAAVLLIGGGVAYGLGVARSASKVIATDVRPILAQPPIAVAPQKRASLAAPDPMLEQRLRDFQEALAEVWRTGLVDAAAAGTEAEPTSETATATTAAIADAPTMTPALAADADTAAATTTATATEDGATTTAPATETASANTAPKTPTTIAVATDDAATTMAATITAATTEPTTAIANADAAPEPAAATITATATGDASLSSVHVVVYTAPWCGPCIRAKVWMFRHGVAFEERDIDASTDYLRQLRLLTPSPAVPTFDIEGDVMIGFYPKRLLAMIQRAAQRQVPAPSL